jgi:hypothetical protein
MRRVKGKYEWSLRTRGNGDELQLHKQKYVCEYAHGEELG